MSKIGEEQLSDADEHLIQDILESHKDSVQLNNVDKFTEVAQTFEEHEKFTTEIPNPHRNSPYVKFWNRETDRCLNGMTASDGDWIPGYYYFYLNYSPIQKVVSIDGTKKGKKKAKKVTSFPDVWDSDYEFFHYLNEAEEKGEHVNVLKTRRRGYSYKMAAMMNRNYFLIPKSRSFAFAGYGEYLTGADGLLYKAWDIMNFIDEHTAWAKMRQYKDQEDHKRASYQSIEEGKTIEKGYKSEIVGVSLKDSPMKARGKSGKLIVFEESGAFPGLTKAWEIAKESVKQGENVYGLLVALGTGGEEGANFEGAEEMFYSPDGYEIHPTVNIWDQGSLKGKPSCFFVPDYYNLEGGDYMDEDGNSKIENALRSILKRRKKEERSNKDPAEIAQSKAESPITPQEAMMSMTGGFFPTDDLRRRLSVLETSKEEQSSDVGYFKLDQETRRPKWVQDHSVPVIREFPLRNKHIKEGAIEIWEHPTTDAEGNVTGLYIAGMDTADDDDPDQSNSLLSVFIMNALTRKLVAEYTGRPTFVKHYYENMRRLLMYYAATCNYENNKKGVFTYFENHACTHLLCKTPQMLKDKQMTGGGKIGNAAYGTLATAQINAFARKLIREWLLEPTHSDPDVRYLDTIKSRALLKELVKWEKDGNFDRVSALGMLMLYEESERKYLTGDIDPSDPKGSPEAYDDFFESVKPI